MVHLWWGEYLRWQSTSDDVHTPADQPWKLWHLFKLLFVLRPLKYHQNHNPLSLSLCFCIRNCVTWAKVLTKSKDFKWFRRSPLLHNSWNKVIFKKIITCHLPVQGRMVTFRCTPQAFWPGLGGSRFSSPFNEDIRFEKALKLQQVTILQFNKKRKYRILDIWQDMASHENLSFFEESLLLPLIVSLLSLPLIMKIGIKLS